ncbi:UDP-N-acetylglucosamine 2-epimerase (hydrolyzing) [Desulfuromonas acetoxidans]|uniref:UDP-N-acetylglucosamine 2-epimerase n=1 Tax=Desulfuromonas acetoxidans (strain DSM 684 / 11070) TaxID=281689 RepID=Q1K171_DESA6|nr:UDP-N-acetylglucosamine 2-epimerase [Desulfuromonas acetoxidans]EAT16137.1 UDP-N-acetylglucosamine 2-epimerase [Desulfuromonas acetoxidans DSM 684]MBF0646443.1 UDP-N-acetylglucosamine 2-epimerase (hydrolyzing) [Desulfuromonas acetoxidans]NVD25510.1 UDP-N-acetylglucosamine 2-epimerase (hydrolyzing) [Desulfuromonas acetoxidans]NVE17540.1 UDP-N-acetylglucosamine 2-epimerase (hydrolyzing) [Desulfuromonas acetoxidans]
MTKIAVFTSTRAEYGLLYWLIKELDKHPFFDMQLIVSGTHLSHEFGYTVSDIESDGFIPSIRIPTLISDDSPPSLARSSALLAMALTDYFYREKPDFFVVLGDRFELLAACEAALICQVPIVHIHGGEITEGAVDERVRHAVTKLADIHFASTEEYCQRIIQMGEDPAKVIKSGALGLESIRRGAIWSLEETSEVLGVDLGKDYILVVYHPETCKKTEDVAPLFEALSSCDQYQKIIIYPNSDSMSRTVIDAIQAFKSEYPRQVTLVKSLKREGYLSLLKHCCLYIGNSSSGIIEAPTFRRPIINVGKRQYGRIRSEATLDVEMDCVQLLSALETALSQDYLSRLDEVENPYGGGFSSQIIIDSLSSLDGNLLSQKKFHDLDI